MKKMISARLALTMTRSLVACGQSTSAASSHAAEPPSVHPAGNSSMPSLPESKGGGVVAKRYSDQVRHLSVAAPYELLDADSPEDLNILQMVRNNLIVIYALFSRIGCLLRSVPIY